MKPFKSLLLTAAVALTPITASAAPVTFLFNGGPVLDVAYDDPFLPTGIGDFVLGENVIVSVTYDVDTAFGSAVGLDEVVYFDPVATITLSGSQSGAMVTLAPGAQIQVQNQNEFDVSSDNPLGPPPEFLALSLFLLDDTDFRSGTDFLTNPTDLATTLADIDNLFVDGVATLPNLASGSSAELFYIDTEVGAEAGELISFEQLINEEADFFFAMEFGPVAAVPLPAGFPLILTGLASIALLRRKKRSA